MYESRDGTIFPGSKNTINVIGIDHLSIAVSDYKTSKKFYRRLFFKDPDGLRFEAMHYGA